jgi:hypothetical protein
MRKFSFLLAIIPFYVQAQSDSSTPLQTVNTVFKQSTDQIIYNGKEHLGYAARIEGIAYYQTKDWQPGTMTYHDVYFPDVFLKYDLVSNELIIRHHDNGIGISLFTPRLKNFSFSGKKFIVFSGEEKGLPPAGIYEQIATGKISFYIHRSKFIKETIEGLELRQQFITNDTYYLVKDGMCYPVKHQKDLSQLTKEKRAEIRKVLKGQGLRFRMVPEAVLTETVNYYNKTVN